MPNEVAKQLSVITTVAATPTAYFTLAANKRAMLTSINLFNSSGSAVTVKVYRVPSGGSPSAANQIYEAALTSKESFSWMGLRVLDVTGDSIRAEAGTASVVTIELDGVQEDVT